MRWVQRDLTWERTSDGRLGAAEHDRRRGVVPDVECPLCLSAPPPHCLGHTRGLLPVAGWGHMFSRGRFCLQRDCGVPRPLGETRDDGAEAGFRSRNWKWTPQSRKTPAQWVPGSGGARFFVLIHPDLLARCQGPMIGGKTPSPQNRCVRPGWQAEAWPSTTEGFARTLSHGKW